MANSTDLVIHCGTLIDGTGAPPLHDVSLVIRKGKIEEVLPGRKAPGGLPLLDCSAKTLMPGMIDAHVHLVFAPLQTHEAVIAEYTASDTPTLTLRALQNAQAAFRAGVTTVRDCGDRDFITDTVKRAIDRGIATGPRILVGGPPITTTGGHCHFLGGRADTKEEILKAVRKRVERGADFIKVMATGGNMTPGSNNRSAQYTLDELTLLVSEAHRLQKRVAAHTLATEGIRTAVAAGADTLEHCTWLAPTEAQGLEYDSACVDEMVAKGLYWSNTITGLMRPLITGEPLAMPRKLIDDWFLLFRRMYDQGVKMLISSDAGVRNTRFEEFAVGVHVAAREMELESMAAIEAVTRLPAEALGIADVVGTAVPGKVADLIVLDRDPLADIAALRHVERVIKNGVPVVHNGRL